MEFCFVVFKEQVQGPSYRAVGYDGSRVLQFGQLQFTHGNYQRVEHVTYLQTQENSKNSMKNVSIVLCVFLKYVFSTGYIVMCIIL